MENIRKNIGKNIHGYEFLYKYPNLSKKLIKLTNELENDDGVQIVFGENYNYGGVGKIYFTNTDDLAYWLECRNPDKDSCGKKTNTYAKYYRKVTIVPDSMIYLERWGRFRTNHVILGKREKISDMEMWSDTDYCINALKISHKALKFVVNFNEEIQLAAVRRYGKVIKRLLKLHLQGKIIDPISEQVMLEAVSQNGLSIKYIAQWLTDIRLLYIKISEKIKLAAVRQNGLAIKYLFENYFDLSEEVKLTAVSQNGLAIKYFYLKDNFADDLSEEVKIAAVRQNGYAIKYLFKYSTNTVSEEVKIEAVSQNGSAIKYILGDSSKFDLKLDLKSKSDYISENVKIAAVSQNGISIIKLFKMNIPVSNEVALAAVKKNGLMIFNILEAGIPVTDDMKLAAVEQNKKALAHLFEYNIDVPEKVQIAAVKKDGDMVKKLLENKINVSEEVKMEAVKQNGKSIKHLLDFDIGVSDEMMIAAIKQDVHAFYFLKDKKIEVSEEVQIAIIRKDSCMFGWIKNPSEKVRLAYNKLYESHDGYTIYEDDNLDLCYGDGRIYCKAEDREYGDHRDFSE